MKKILFLFLNIIALSGFAQIQAITETIDYQNAPNASGSISVLANDFLNGLTPSANDVIVSGINIPSGFTLNADGTFDVALGTAASVYTFTYSICETANPSNCSSVTGLFNLTSNIQAITETIDYQNAPNASGSISVLANDFLNGLTPSANDVIVSGINIPSGFTLNADGTFDVALGTAASVYTFTYSICETANPTNCSSVTGLFNLTSSIEAITETIDYQNAPNASGSISVLANDFLNGLTPSANDVIVSGINIPSGFTLNADGTFDVALGTAASVYTFIYSICETANPTNCSSVTGLFNLTSNIEAIDDLFNFPAPPTSGSIESVLDNDSLNNSIPNTNNVIVSVINIPSGFSLNDDGTITIPASFSMGNFSIDYKICEIGYPNNCAIGNVSIVVSNPFPPVGDAFQGMPVTGNLLGLQVIGQNILWYSSLIGDPIPSTTIVEMDSTYYASQTVNGVESINKLAVTISSAPLNIDNIDLENLKFYPNPIVDDIFISNDKTIDEIEIISAFGNVVMYQKINDVQCAINLTNLEKGMYFMKVDAGNDSKVLKIIKQ
jgi:hypothetical protein